MKVYLFGGAEKGQAEAECRLIEKVIKKLKPAQILHIPFARISTSEAEWSGDWFHRYIHLNGTVYLNANNEKDILMADSPLIFMSGGSTSSRLIKKINENPRLLNLIKNADFIIGESAGSKVLGEYQRIEDGRLARGLGILKDTIIEPHYSVKNRQELLSREMKEINVRYGIGIDSVTAMVAEVYNFPDKYETMGLGKVELKKHLFAS